LAKREDYTFWVHGHSIHGAVARFLEFHCVFSSPHCRAIPTIMARRTPEIARRLRISIGDSHICTCLFYNCSNNICIIADSTKLSLH
jgi:hypothetical protein